MASNPHIPTPDRSSNPSPEGSENYSVDEMMSRLKRNERQKTAPDSRKEGELVTREDGTQVVKVRRRKRRSKQPAKKVKQTNSKIKWAILGCLIGIFVILIAGTIFIIAKYNGSSFKGETESIICNLTGAESADFTQLRVTPVSAKSTKVELAWDKHSFFHSATFNALRADILATSFFSNEWIGEEVVAEVGKIQIQAPKTTVENPATTVHSPYNFGTFRCNQLYLQFGSGRDAPAITDMQVSLREQVNGHHQIVFNKGLMKIPNWPSLEIASGIMTLNTSDVNLEARLEARDGLKGELIIKGRVAKDTSRPIVLDVKAKDFPIQDLLGKELGRIIKGEINSDMGSLSYDYNKDRLEALSFIMPFNSTELRLSELPLFSDLKDLTGDTQYVRPILTHCSGTIMRTSEGVTLNDLALISSRVITLKGNITVTPNGTLSGELQVGIPARRFSKKSPAPSIFSEPHNGSVYVQVTLGGSIHNPHDNLNELLKSNQASIAPTPRPKTVPLSPIERALEEAKQKEQDFEDITR